MHAIRKKENILRLEEKGLGAKSERGLFVSMMTCFRDFRVPRLSGVGRGWIIKKRSGNSFLKSNISVGC